MLALRFTNAVSTSRVALMASAGRSFRGLPAVVSGYDLTSAPGAEGDSVQALQLQVTGVWYVHR